MKRAHEGSMMSCALFRKHVMDFVDDELPETAQSGFRVHVEACPACMRELREIENLRKHLAGLPTVTVSPEFDFRLKASLRMEDVRLRNPFYRAKLYVQDNLVPVVGLPVAAALLLAGLAYYEFPFQEETAPVAQRTAPAPERGKAPVPVADVRTADVNYVLESLNIGTTGIEVTSNGKSGVSTAQPELKTVSSINF